MTNQILRPVNALVDAAEKVSAGDLTAHVNWKNKDELGVLSHTFNAMTASIREKTELIEQKNRENERLLLNILPGEIAARLKDGEQEIADSFADVPSCSATSWVLPRCQAELRRRKSLRCSMACSANLTNWPRNWG